MLREEVKGALKKMKDGEAAALDGIAVEMLKNEAVEIIFSRFMKTSIVPEDWGTVMSIFPICKRRCYKRKCTN